MWFRQIDERGLRLAGAKNGCEKTGEKTVFSPKNAGFREGKKQFGAARPGFVQNHEGASC
jgi:hypothetical protein